MSLKLKEDHFLKFYFASCGINVLNTNKPQAIPPTSIKIARQGGDQGAHVKRTRGSWGKSSTHHQLKNTAGWTKKPPFGGFIRW
jgi:hypothetical protein